MQAGLRAGDAEAKGLSFWERKVNASRWHGQVGAGFI